MSGSSFTYITGTSIATSSSDDKTAGWVIGVLLTILATFASSMGKVQLSLVLIFTFVDVMSNIDIGTLVTC
jgi:hypothetical protein